MRQSRVRTRQSYLSLVRDVDSLCTQLLDLLRVGLKKSKVSIIVHEEPSGSELNLDLHVLSKEEVSHRLLHLEIRVDSTEQRVSPNGVVWHLSGINKEDFWKRRDQKWIQIELHLVGGIARDVLSRVEV